MFMGSDFVYMWTRRKVAAYAKASLDLDISAVS